MSKTGYTDGRFPITGCGMGTAVSVHNNEYMNGIFRFIENNIASDFDIGLITDIGYVSYDKLYRDFYSATGHSVKEYVRKRRLSNALALIKTSDLSLTDIALRCGYSSHQALCRAVRQTLGLTPSVYKNAGVYYFFPPFNGKPLHSVIISNEIIPRTLCIRYYRSEPVNIENMAIDSFMSTIPGYSGRVFGKNRMHKGSKYCYELYLTDTDVKIGRQDSIGFEIG